MIRARALVVAFLFLNSAALAGAGEPRPTSTAWSGKSPAVSRVILESSEFAGESAVRAGVQIKLDEGWWTYWRAPGASGMPPMFDWSGSENVAGEPETIWPVPLRAVEYGESLNLYRDEEHTLFAQDQLVRIPEPATLGALLLVGLAIVRRR